MLYLKKEIPESGVLAIWKMDETVEELMAGLSSDSLGIVQPISKIRLAEQLTVRFLLKELLGEEKEISYTSSGRPFLNDGSFHLSISHTKDYVAVVLDREARVGVDIEKFSDKIKTVRSRIVSGNEYIDPDNELVHLLLHWSAKETMFKILDKRGVDFLHHLQVMPFKPESEGCFETREERTRHKYRFLMDYQVFPDFVLVYSLLK